MPSDLTPTRLRELIAAATPECDWCSDCGADLGAKRDLQEYLVNNAPALADALEAKELLEWAISHGLSYWEREVGNVAVNSIESLRAAKEAADGTKRKEDQ